MMNRTVKDAREIDVNWCNREGLLDESQSGVLRWTDTDTGEDAASMQWHYVESEGVDTFRLSYRVTPKWGNREPRDVSYTVPVEWTPCNFGGERPWFRCPVCDDRVAKLYSSPRRDEYACRDCQGLIYESQTGTSATLEASRRLSDATDRIESGDLSHESLREFYDAKQGLFSAFDDHMDHLDEQFGEYGRGTDGFRMGGLPPFEQWADDLFHKAFGSAGGRPYGFYGRCTATAKTTGERCQQPATGEHRKCYYHGGADGTGVGEEQVDRQAEAARERMEELLDDADGTDVDALTGES